MIELKLVSSNVAFKRFQLVPLHRGRGSTTAMQEYVGAPKAQKAENVASDDIVFKRYINNERKKKPRK